MKLFIIKHNQIWNSCFLWGGSCWESSFIELPCPDRKLPISFSHIVYFVWVTSFSPDTIELCPFSKRWCKTYPTIFIIRKLGNLVSRKLTAYKIFHLKQKTRHNDDHINKIKILKKKIIRKRWLNFVYISENK